MTLSLFPINSRYSGAQTGTLALPDGTQAVYVLRRFVPPASRFALIVEHTVIGGERLDNIAAQYLGDPELYWRLCDANEAMWPDDLTAVAGRKLRITLPEGVPGPRSV